MRAKSIVRSRVIGVSALLFLPISCFACPGCSMFNLLTSFRHEGDAKWAYVIVFGILAVPVLLKALGYRLERREKISPWKKWLFTLILSVGWIGMVASDSFAPNFGVLLMHWFYLPLAIQFNFIMAIAFYIPLLLIVSVFIIPVLYCYKVSCLLLRYDITRNSSEHTTDDSTEADAA